MEDILHDHHESRVIKYAWKNTSLGISCIANKVWLSGIMDWCRRQTCYMYLLENKKGLLQYCGTESVFQVNANETGFSNMDFKMHTLPFSWRQDCTFGSGKFVMGTQGSKHCWKGMSNSYEWGRARIVVLPMRRDFSWKKQDPPYRLMDVLASVLSDQLSCWLHQGV